MATALRDRILKIYEEQERLETRLKELEDLLQRSCKHESIAETPYRSPSFVLYSQNARRICLICGLEEDGAFGWNKLRTEPVVIIQDRNEFYGYRRIRPLAKVNVPVDLT